MTREEAVTRAQNALNDPIAKGGGAAMLDLDTLRALISGPIPDPETGLVPCGCGGEARFEPTDNEQYPVMARCQSCFVRTDEMADEDWARQRWNNSNGYYEEEE